jgi:anaerobic selenocysteine-containing dehydrogenase
MSTPTYPTRTVTGVCPHDCPDSCGWLVTVEDRPTGPVAVKLRGNPDHPYSKGELCPKVNRYLERVNSPDRVLSPLRRTGAKGEGRFEPIGWDVALGEIADRWRAVIDRHGPSALVPFASAGNQSELAIGFGNRLFDALGASTIVGTVCGAVAAEGTALTYGTGQADDPRELAHAKTVLLWGTNTRLTNRHLWPEVKAAQANGATIVVIDPVRTMTAEAADVFVQPLPGTDTALILAMMHELIRNDWIDHDYLEAHATGFADLAAHVANWTPERAAAVCGLAVEEVTELARLYGTNRPSFVRTLIGAEHGEQGAAFFRAAAMLPVLTGAWRERGGGYARSVGVYSAGALNSLSVPELATGDARRELQANHIGRWLEDRSQGVHALLVWGANPVVTMPNAEAIRRGLRRDDLFTVVHEQFLSDTAAYADIVLPASTQIEADDLMASWGSPHVTYNHAAIAPRGDAVSNTELFRRLAGAIGLDHPALHQSDECLIAALVADRPHISLERLLAEGTVEVPIGPQRYRDGGFATPDGKAALASAELAERGLGLVPDWQPAQEGVGADPETVARYPFILATPKTHTRFLNSSYSHLPGHGDREGGGPFVELSAADAAALGVVDGQVVTVHNQRGQVSVPVRISARVRPGLVAIPFGWHAAAYSGGCDSAAGGCGTTANALTSDTLANAGGGVAFNDTRVAIRVGR